MFLFSLLFISYITFLFSWHWHCLFYLPSFCVLYLAAAEWCLMLSRAGPFKGSTMFCSLSCQNPCFLAFHPLCWVHFAFRLMKVSFTVVFSLSLLFNTYSFNLILGEIVREKEIKVNNQSVVFNEKPNWLSANMCYICILIVTGLLLVVLLLPVPHQTYSLEEYSFFFLIILQHSSPVASH